MSANAQLKKLLTRMAAEKTGDFTRRANLDKEEVQAEKKLRKEDREAQVAERLFEEEEITPMSERISAVKAREEIRAHAQEFVNLVETKKSLPLIYLIESIRKTYKDARKTKKFVGEVAGLKKQLIDLVDARGDKVREPEELKRVISNIDSSAPPLSSMAIRRPRRSIVPVPAPAPVPAPVTPPPAAAAAPRTPDSTASLPGLLRELQSASSKVSKRTRSRTAKKQ